MAKTKKADFQALAERRLREARVLLAANEPDGAYYLGGYAVECALKTCIIKMLNASDEWQERNFSGHAGIRGKAFICESQPKRLKRGGSVASSRGSGGG